MTIRSIAKFLGWSALLVAIAEGAAIYSGARVLEKYEARAREFDLAQIDAFPQRSVMLDQRGDVYSHLHGENRFVIPFEKVAPSFIQALLAREDARFWEHGGVDFAGIARAAFTNARHSEVRQGASTITQQLARNTFALSGRTFDRKALEAVLARRIEQSFSKQQILTAYVNRIYFGEGYYGVEAAARGYFGKSADALSVPESATLAALICSPNRLGPRKNPAAAETERDAVIARMAELAWISDEDAAAARATPLRALAKDPLVIRADHVVDAVQRELVGFLKEEIIAAGGLRIHTTIDVALQREAEAAMERQLAALESAKKYPHPRKADFSPATSATGEEKPTDYLQAAIVAMDNRTGGIKAIVGGRDFSESHYPRATLSKRQVGSTFKPFVYATAFERGLLPCSLIDDSAIDPDAFRPVSANWSPRNSDGQYLGYQRADFGLIKSRNTMAVRVGQWVGLPTVRRVADALHIGETIQDYPVTYLGAFETTLRDLTAAYTVFPNHGVWQAPHLIQRIDDAQGRTLYSAPATARRVFTQERAWMTSQILQQVMQTGTAAKAASLGWKGPAGGKTGTTDDFRDAWFVGYTGSLTCGVWVGMDRPQTIMEKGYGATLALPIWIDVMKGAPPADYPAEKLAPPVPMARVHICRQSGLQATSECDALRTASDELLPATRCPGRTCHLHPSLMASTTSDGPMLRYTKEGIPVARAEAVRRPQLVDARATTPGGISFERTSRGLRFWTTAR